MILLVVISCEEPMESRGDRTVLIGLDGGTWYMLAQLIQKNELPNFAKMVRGGVYGNLLADPPYSPPSWTTLATGKSPENHGVDEFVWKRYDNEESGKYGFLPTRSNHVESKRLWNILNDHGLKTGVCYWLFTWPLEQVDGLMVSDHGGFAADFLRQRNLQSDIYNAFEQTRWLDRDLKITGDIHAALDEENMEDAFKIRDKIVLDEFLKGEQKFSTARYILNAYPELDFFSICFYWGNDLQHKFMHYASNPEYYGVGKDEKERYSDVIPMFYRNLDSYLGEILDDRTVGTVAIVSDHGMESIPLGAETTLKCYHFMTDIDRILCELGYQERDLSTGEIDWSRTRAYSCLYKRTEQGVSLNVEGREEHGIVTKETAPALIDSISAALAGVRFAESGRHLWSEIFKPDGGWPELSFDGYHEIVYGMESELLSSDIIIGDAIVPAHEIITYPGFLIKSEHGYDFDGVKPFGEYGIILLYGKNFKEGFKLQDRKATTADLVPTLLYNMALPVGDDMDGHIMLEAFKEEYTDHYKAGYIPSYETFGAEKVFLDEGEQGNLFDKQEIERLRALGYVK